MPLHQAIASCESLGESLWTVNSNFSNIQNDLNYLLYQHKYTRTQQYWIAPEHNTPSTIDVDGHIKQASSETRLPVLCSQSAPYSTPSSKNTNATWQVGVYSNNESITG